jgi:hypothetical protein
VRALVLCVALAGCNAPDPPPIARESATPAAGKVELIVAAPGDSVQALALREGERARAEGRELVLYVGAVWCEPCQYFHDAAARGELDATFPRLTVLELDRDKDEARLGAAGCLSDLIPLFAAPAADGSCDPERRIMGSIKGPGAVANITPRLRGLLDRSAGATPNPGHVDTRP